MGGGGDYNRKFTVCLYLCFYLFIYHCMFLLFIHFPFFQSPLP